jgi:hypothetical protein
MSLQIASLLLKEKLVMFYRQGIVTAEQLAPSVVDLILL